MANPAPKVKKSPMWNMVGTVLLVAVLLGQMKKVVNKPTVPVREPDAATAESLSAQMVASARAHLRERLANASGFREISHQVHRLPHDKTNSQYRVVITYRVANGYGGSVVEKRCYNFTRQGILSNTYEYD